MNGFMSNIVVSSFSSLFILEELGILYSSRSLPYCVQDSFKILCLQFDM